MKLRSPVSWTLVMVAVVAAAPPIDMGNSVCYEVQQFVRGLVDYTDTACWAAPSEKRPSMLSFIVISSKPIFSVEASKKGWLITAVAAVGKTLNDKPSMKTDELWLSDASLMGNRIAHVLPTSLAKSLQRDTFNGRMDVEQMYRAIQKNLVQKTITKDVQ